MKRLGWRALMHKGLVELKLCPDVFWALTPAELALMAGLLGGSSTLSKKGLAALLEKFPDAPGRPRLREDDINREVK